MSEYYIDDYTPARSPQKEPEPYGTQQQIVESPSPQRPRRERRISHRSQPQLRMDLGELLKRAVKYAIQGIAVALVAYMLFKNRMKLSTKDILILAGTAALTFAILDTFVPTVSLGAKLGAGFGLGQALLPMAIAL